MRPAAQIMIGAAAVGICVAVALVSGAASAGIQNLPLGRTADGEAYTVDLQLAGADGLVLGADVRSGQKVIGRVSELSTDVVGANVTLSLESAVPLPDNVEATVELPSALGNPFIRLRPPDAPSSSHLRGGDTIPESRSSIGPQIESALATLGTILTGSGIDQLDSVVRELNTAFTGRSGEVRSLTTALTTLTSSASRHQDEFDAAIDLAARISSQLAGQREAVDHYLTAAPQVLEILAGQKDRIRTLLDSTTRLAVNANAVLDSSPNGIESMISDAGTVVGTLDSFNANIGRALANMSEMLESFSRSVHGDYLVFDGTLDIVGTIDKLWSGGVTTGTMTAPGTLTDLMQGGRP